MKITGIIWLHKYLEKINSKHHVSRQEVEDVFKGKFKNFFAQKGKYEGEDKYLALGRTHSERYLLVIYIYKKSKKALIITARDMTKNERKLYAKN